MKRVSMDAAINPQELIDLALLACTVMVIVVLVLLVSHLRHRAARLQAERRLEAAQARIGAILDAAVPGIIVLDHEGIVETFNVAAERMFGYAGFEMVGQNINTFKLFEIPSADDAADGGHPNTPFIPTGSRAAVGLQVLGKRKTGATFPAELFVSETRLGRRRLIVGVVHDITDRRKSEEAAKKETVASTDILDSVGALVVMLDADGKILQINHACQQVTGYREEEVAGRYLWDVFLTPEDLAPDRDSIAKTRHRGVARKGETDWLTKDRRRRRIAWRLTWLAAAEAPPQYMLIAGIDITERVKAGDQMLEAHVLDSLERFAGELSSRFTDWLTAASGYAELVLTTLEKDDPVRKDVVEIHDSAEKAVALARELQSFGRRMILLPRLLDVSRVLGGLQAQLEPALGSGITMEFALAPSLGLVSVDQAGFEKAIMTLARYAGGMLGGRGTILLRTIEVQAGTTGPCVMVAVIAPHLQMEPAACTRVFEPFPAPAGASGEAGFGIAPVYGFVRQSGGDIHVSSQPGRGTRFEIYLPRVEPAPEPDRSSIPSATRD